MNILHTQGRIFPKASVDYGPALVHKLYFFAGNSCSLHFIIISIIEPSCIRYTFTWITSAIAYY